MAEQQNPSETQTQTGWPRSDCHALSNRIKEFKSTFDTEISILLGSVRTFELAKMEADRNLEKFSPELFDQKFRGGNSLDGVLKNEKMVETFFGSDEYTDVMNNLPKIIDQRDYDDLLVSLTKVHYYAARDVLFEEIDSLLRQLFMYQRQINDRPDNDVEVIRMRNISNAYGTLLSCIPKDQKEKLNEAISKKAFEKLQLHKRLKNIWKKCQEHVHKAEFRTFYQRLPSISYSMVSISPPMVIHTNEKETNHSLLQGSPVAPPLHWERPVIMKNYKGTPLVQGIAVKKDNDINDFAFINHIM